MGLNELLDLITTYWILVKFMIINLSWCDELKVACPKLNNNFATFFSRIPKYARFTLFL